MFLTSAELTKAVGAFNLYKTLIAFGIVSIIVLCVCMLFLGQHARLLTLGCIGFAVVCLILVSMTTNPNPNPALTKETLTAVSERVCNTNRRLLVKEMPVKEYDTKVAKKWVGFIEGCNNNRVTITRLKNAADAEWDAESVVNVLGKDGMYAIQPELGTRNSNLEMVDGISHFSSMEGDLIPLAQFYDDSIGDSPVTMAAVGSIVSSL